MTSCRRDAYFSKAIIKIGIEWRGSAAANCLLHFILLCHLFILRLVQGRV
jgi:hypothetical protein